MVNPGTFAGLRKQFLDSQSELYAAAVRGKHVPDTVADIQRRYFKRFPITLAHSEEPSQDFLDSVDDNAPDPDLAPTKVDKDDVEGRARAQRLFELQLMELKIRKEQIKRRLQYQHNKSSSQKTTFEVGSTDPMAALMAKLTGNTIQKPRHKTAYNLWGPQNRSLVDPIFNERMRDNNIPSKNHAALRSAIYKELFEDLPPQERQEWTVRADKEHKDALDKVNAALRAGASTAPEDRQRVIELLPQFIEPILDLVAEHTGWKVSLIAGGPEPADGGRLNMISVHSGVISGSVKMNFGRSERVAYKDFVVPTFGRFLKKCYSIQECRSRALPEKDRADFAGLAAGEDQYGVEVHTFDDGSRFVDEEYVKIVAPGHRTPSSSGVALKSTTKPRHQASPTNGRVKQPAPVTQGTPSTQANGATVDTQPAPSSPVKIGPPRGGKKPHASINTAEADKASQDKRTASAPVLKTADVDTRQGSSRGPTPVPSRQSTPAPSRPPNVDSKTTHTPPLQTFEDGRSSLSSAMEPRADGHTYAPTRAMSAMPENHIPSMQSTSLVRAKSAGPENHISQAPVTLEDARVAIRAFVTPSSASSNGDTDLSCPSTSLELTHIAAHSTAGPSPISDPEVVPSGPDARPALELNADASPACTAMHVDVASPTINDSPPTEAPKSPEPSGTAPIHRDCDAPRPVSTETPLPCAPGSMAVPDFEEMEALEVHSRGRKRKGTDNELSGNVKKKQRVSGASNGVPGSDGTSTDQPWVTNALQMLQGVPLGPEWDRLVALWLKFERSTDFNSSEMLGTHKRPKAVACWIRRARKPNYRPKGEDAVGLQDNFGTWWRSLQPVWRIDDKGTIRPTVDVTGDEDWSRIRRPGINGLVSVVAALFFWGTLEGLSKRSRKSWLEAVNDVSYVFEHL